MAMEAEEVKKRLHDALHEVVSNDGYLLENNLGERCIAARLMIYLQKAFPEYAVDAEYNRDGHIPKKLGLPEECANRRDSTFPHSGQVVVAAQTSFLLA
jgi:hypothetical protein